MTGPIDWESYQGLIAESMPEAQLSGKKNIANHLRLQWCNVVTAMNSENHLGKINLSVCPPVCLYILPNV